MKRIIFFLILILLLGAIIFFKVYKSISVIKFDASPSDSDIYSEHGTDANNFSTCEVSHNYICHCE